MLCSLPFSLVLEVCERESILLRYGQTKGELSLIKFTNILWLCFKNISCLFYLLQRVFSTHCHNVWLLFIQFHYLTILSYVNTNIFFLASWWNVQFLQYFLEETQLRTVWCTFLCILGNNLQGVCPKLCTPPTIGYC